MPPHKATWRRNIAPANLKKKTKNTRNLIIAAYKPADDGLFTDPRFNKLALQKVGRCSWAFPFPRLSRATSAKYFDSLESGPGDLSAPLPLRSQVQHFCGDATRSKMGLIEGNPFPRRLQKLQPQLPGHIGNRQLRVSVSAIIEFGSGFTRIFCRSFFPDLIMIFG